MLAFIHIRKTAGSTIDMVFRQSFGMGHCCVRHHRARAAAPVITAAELDRCRWIYRRMKTVSGHGIVPYSDLHLADPEIRFFTFLRDPIARCASDYQFRVQRGGMRMPFERWITTDIARNQQTKKLAAVEDAAAAIASFDSRISFVGLVERFNASLVLLRKWSQIPQLDIRYRSKNVAKDVSIKDRLLNGPDTREMLIEANQEDQKLYDYVAEEVYPRQVQAYGESLAADVQLFEATNAPLPVYPRQLMSMLLRELVYKPLVPVIHDKTNPPPQGQRAA
ncbi:MAG TPA: sulfotransferase family 2 domain-containing protein [Pirellulales bacterium]|nr:sulfotransferase family 2 domain-containing protein [Pirellulales bacterium]